MATMQKLLAPGMSTGSRYGSCWASTANAVAAAAHEQFPAGLRVLVVDDDVTCLKILEHMLQKCRYCVTTCSQAMTALSLLRERKDGFDVVISDVHMPDMDGFKLLEHVGLEMDLPVIMMSADGRTSAVMRGIKHGACDYLIKPVRMEELKNVWQHVVRKKWIENKDVEHSGSFEESNRPRRVADESEYASEGTYGSRKSQKKRKESKDDEDDDDGELENEDPLASKKSRVVWSVELHQQFVNAVYQLGIEKSVPKRIMEIMNVPGLTRENVASHLQKFRLYLKRISGVTQYQCGLSNSLCSPLEANNKIGSLGRPDFHSFASAGQIPAESLAALHAELLGRPSGSIVLPAMDQSVILQASSQGSKFLPSKRVVAFGQALFKCQSEILKRLPPSGITTQDISSGFTSWPSNQLSVTGPTNKLGGLGSIQNNNLLMQMLQQQQQAQDVFHSVVTESHNAINVQPSCLVAPYQSPNSLNCGSGSVSTSQISILAPSQPSSNIHFGSNPVLSASNSTFNATAINFDYSVLSSLSNNVSLGMGHVSDGDLKNIGMLSNYSPPDSVSSSVSSSSVCTSSSAVWKLQNSKMNIGSTSGLPAHLPNLYIQGSEVKSGTSINQVQVRNLGFVGKGTCIPSRFAVDDLESPTKDHSYIKTSIFDDVEKVKQEFNLDFLDGSKVGSTMRTGALSKDSSAVYFLKS